MKIYSNEVKKKHDHKNEKYNSKRQMKKYWRKKED